jgi:hypothetical protein
MCSTAHFVGGNGKPNRTSVGFMASSSGPRREFEGRGRDRLAGPDLTKSDLVTHLLPHDTVPV